MKNIFSTILDVTYENLETLKKDTGDNVERFDAFMVWVIGFATAGITILIGGLEVSKKYLGTISVKAIIILFAVCIIAGIVYRYAHIFVRHYDVQILNRVGLFLRDLDLPPSKPEDVSDVTDYAEMVELLKVYKVDFSTSIPTFENANNAQKIILLDHIKHRYGFEATLATSEYDAADKFIHDTIQNCYQYSDKKMQKLRDLNNAKWLKRFSKLYSYGFFISLLSFIACVILVVISYLYMN